MPPRLPLFLLFCAVVLIVFALIAAAQKTLTLFTIQWQVWLCAAIMSFLIEVFVKELFRHPSTPEV